MLLLEGVGADLLCNANAAALVVADVDENAVLLLRQRGQRFVQLRPAVAAHAAEDVAGDADAVHAREHGGGALDVALDKRDVLDVVAEAAEDHEAEEGLLRDAAPADKVHGQQALGCQLAGEEGEGARNVRKWKKGEGFGGQ